MAQTVWGLPVILYLFLGGMGAGAYLTARWAERYPDSSAVVRVGRWLSGPLVAVGTVLLVFDLGAGKTHPWRILWLYTDLHSVMTWGTWLLTMFVPVALVHAFAPAQWTERQRWLHVVGVTLAIGVALYTGVLLAVLKAIPLWNNGLLPVLFVISAVSTGVAATVLPAVLIDPRVLRTAEGFRSIHLAVVVSELLVLTLFLFFTAEGSAAGRLSYDMLTTGSLAAAFWIGIVLVGLVLPLLLMALGAGFRSFTLQRNAVVIEALAVLVGGFFLRYVIVHAGIPQVLF